MKFIAASITAIFALLITGCVTNAAVVNGQNQALATRAGGGFAGSCRDIVMARRKFMSGTYFDVNAKCEKFDYRELDNRLQLGLCLVNDAGVLKWSKRGNFDKSCQYCSIKVSKNEVTLGCLCLPAYDRATVWVEINLNDGIRNVNGQLWCGDEIGISS